MGNARAYFKEGVLAAKSKRFDSIFTALRQAFETGFWAMALLRTRFYRL
jgi:hypothetical protein